MPTSWKKCVKCFLSSLFSWIFVFLLLKPQPKFNAVMYCISLHFLANNCRIILTIEKKEPTNLQEWDQYWIDITCLLCSQIRKKISVYNYFCSFLIWEQSVWLVIYSVAIPFLHFVGSFFSMFWELDKV